MHCKQQDVLPKQCRWLYQPMVSGLEITPQSQEGSYCWPLLLWSSLPLPQTNWCCQSWTEMYPVWPDSGREMVHSTIQQKLYLGLLCQNTQLLEGHCLDIWSSSDYTTLASDCCGMHTAEMMTKVKPWVRQSGWHEIIRCKSGRGWSFSVWDYTQQTLPPLGLLGSHHKCENIFVSTESCMRPIAVLCTSWSLLVTVMFGTFVSFQRLKLKPAFINYIL